MQEARVALFEDHEDIQFLINDWLVRAGHNIVMGARSVSQAAEVINAAEPGSIDVALVDADLGLSHREGSEVVRMLRQKMGDVAIVGISAAGEPVKGADTNISKLHIEEIVEYINTLER